MEARGVERAYRLRCARCGGDWRAEPVRCPFCGEREHTKLAALASEGRSDLRRVEACTVCLAYVKSVTTLSACAPGDVGLLDLATVDLDVAALEHGYARPARPAFLLGTRVVTRARSGLRAFFGGRA
jgi:FdhE protein